MRTVVLSRRARRRAPIPCSVVRQAMSCGTRECSVVVVRRSPGCRSFLLPAHGAMGRQSRRRKFESASAVCPDRSLRRSSPVLLRPVLLVRLRYSWHHSRFVQLWTGVDYPANSAGSRYFRRGRDSRRRCSVCSAQCLREWWGGQCRGLGIGGDCRCRQRHPIRGGG